MAKLNVTLPRGPTPADLKPYIDAQTRKAVALRDSGVSVYAIAKHLGHAYNTIRAWLDAYTEEDEAVARDADLDILEELLTEARAMVKKSYRMVNAGKLVFEPLTDPVTGLPMRGPDGRVMDDYTKPVLDDAPKRDAIMVTLKVMERKAKMSGTDKERLPALPAPPPGAGAGAGAPPITRADLLAEYNRLTKRNAVDVDAKEVRSGSSGTDLTPEA